MLYSHASTGPLATVSVLPDAAPHAYKCAAAQSMLRDRRAAATTVVLVHRMTMAAPCAPQEGAAGQSSAATNSVRDGATIVAHARVEMDSVDGSAVQRVPGRPVEQQCLDQSSLAQGRPEPPSCDILTIYGAKRALNPKNQG